ncbi:MAG: hypothetical protein ACKOWD_11180 [Rhodoferax sp.]
MNNSSVILIDDICVDHASFLQKCLQIGISDCDVHLISVISSEYETQLSPTIDAPLLQPRKNDALILENLNNLSNSSSFLNSLGITSDAKLLIGNEVDQIILHLINTNSRRLFINEKSSKDWFDKILNSTLEKKIFKRMKIHFPSSELNHLLTIHSIN